VRRDPPVRLAPVGENEKRESKLGDALDYVKCDRCEPPDFERDPRDAAFSDDR